MSDEWGPVIQHDGKGCPCVGRLVRAQRYGMPTIEAVAGSGCAESGYDPQGPMSAWVWGRYMTPCDVVCYQIKRPRALLQLIEMVENLPAPAQPRVDA